MLLSNKLGQPSQCHVSWVLLSSITRLIASRALTTTGGVWRTRPVSSRTLSEWILYRNIEKYFEREGKPLKDEREKKWDQSYSSAEIIGPLQEKDLHRLRRKEICKCTWLGCGLILTGLLLLRNASIGVVWANFPGNEWWPGDIATLRIASRVPGE